MTLLLDIAFVIALCLAPFIVMGILAEAIVRINLRFHR